MNMLIRMKSVSNTVHHSNDCELHNKANHHWRCAIPIWRVVELEVNIAGRGIAHAT